ncbi:MAG: hypothetical protein JSS32_07990 [Verrucomicrobia bacterium]|nr:hypothetical protein [Verrucomicrobiota bacterium]
MKEKHYARLTVDMTPDEHTYLKMASAQLGMSMRQFILVAAFQKMGAIEDEWLAEKAAETLRRLESSQEKVSIES